MQQQTETASEENLKKNIPLLVTFCPVAFCPDTRGFDSRPAAAALWGAALDELLTHMKHAV